MSSQSSTEDDVSPGEALFSTRVVLFTGKGGVGRTTIAAAFAKSAAAAGKRTLLLEVDDGEEGHSPLSRIFGLERFHDAPQALAPLLEACRLEARRGHELFLRKVLPSDTLVRAAVRSKSLDRFLHAAPSFHEMGVFNHLLHLLRETDWQGRPRYESVVIDMPATGHTLALTGLPEILLRLMPTGPIARLLEEGRALLNDPETTSAWVVTLPETLPVTEGLELIEGLEATQVPVGGLIVNRYPENPFSEAEEQALSVYLDRTPMAGMVAFQRLRESRRALERLQERARHPTLTLPDVIGEGRGPVDVLSELLSQEAVRL